MIHNIGRDIALQHIRHVPDDAELGRIILARTREPRTRVLDMHLAGGVHEAGGPPGHDWERVLPIVDVSQAVAVHRVDVVCERLVAHARHAVADRAHARARRQVQREVDGVEEREGRAERVSYEYDGG